MKSALTKKALVVALSAILPVQTAMASLAESNVWKERRSALEKNNPQQPKQIASLPTNFQSSQSLLNQLPSVGTALTQTAKWSETNNKEAANFSKPIRSILDSIPLINSSIQDVYDSKNENTAPIVLLQDVHLNPEAQTNLAAVLQNLISKKQAGLVGVEGAFDLFDFSAFRAFPDKKITKEVSDEFLKKNYLAAPSYVGITSAAELPPILGVDDLDRYKSNVNAYLATINLKEKTKRDISSSMARLTAEKERVFSAELKSFDDLRVDYHRGQLGLGAYVKRISALNSNTDFILDQFLQAYTMESTLDFQRVDRERRTALEKLTQKLKEKELSSLLAQSLEYRMGRISFGVYYRDLKNLCESKGVSLKQTPAFDNYIRYVLLSDGIKVDKLFSALNKFENEILASLAKTKEEQELASASEHLLLTEKLIDFSLTSSEWEKYKVGVIASDRRERGNLKAEPELEIARPPSFVAGKSHKSLLAMTKSFEQFYEQADIRSHKMFANLTSHKSQHPLVLVTGGFHTPQIAQLLKNQKISYVIVSPKITKIDEESGTEYLSIFAREKSSLDQMFKGEKLFLAPAQIMGVGGTGQTLDFARDRDTRLRQEMGLPIPGKKTLGFISEAPTREGFDANGIALSKPAIQTSLQMMQAAINEFVKALKGDSLIQLKGLTGSYTEGKPRIGLFTRQISFLTVHNLLVRAKYNADMEDREIPPEALQLPSDIDLTYTLKSASIDSLATAETRLFQLSRIIYEKYGVFIQPIREGVVKTRVEISRITGNGFDQMLKDRQRVDPSQGDTSNSTNPASIFYRHYLAKQEGRNYNPILAWMGNPITGSPVWEVIFNLSIPLTLHFLPGMTLIAGLVWLISNFLFAKSHADRSPPEQKILFVMGLIFGLPFFITGLDVFSQSLISIFLHSLYNYLVLTGKLPKWMPVATIRMTGTPPLDRKPGDPKIEIIEKTSPGWTYIGQAQIGGEKNKHFLVDANNQLWIFKENPYANQPYRALGAYIYNQFVRIFFSTPVLVRLAQFDGKLGTLEKVLLKVNAHPPRPWADMSIQQVNEEFSKCALPNFNHWNKAAQGDFSTPLAKNVLNLTDQQTQDVLQEMVLAWLFSNHDTHAGNYLVDESGRIIGIDQEQVFKYFQDGKYDLLSLQSLPNGHNFTPLHYLILTKLAMTGKLNLSLIENVLKRIEEIPDNTLRSMIRPFAEQYVQANPGKFQTPEEFIEAFISRKQSLRANFSDFFDAVNNQIKKTINAQFFLKDQNPGLTKFNKIGLMEIPTNAKDFLKTISGVDKTSFLQIIIDKDQPQGVGNKNKPTQEPVFNKQVDMNKRLAELYGLPSELIEQIKLAGDDPAALAQIVENYYKSLKVRAGPSVQMRLLNALKSVRERIMSRSKTQENLKIRLRLLTSWIASLKKQKSNFHRVYLARDAGIFHLVDQTLEKEQGKISEYDRGSSVYHLSTPRMSGENSHYVYRVMKDIIGRGKAATPNDNDIGLLYKNIRKEFHSVYNSDPIFRKMVDAVRDELLEIGYDDQTRLIFVDTGFRGTMPFFLKNTLDLGKDESDLLGEDGEENIQVAIVQPTDIGFAKQIFGFNFELLSPEEQSILKPVLRNNPQENLLGLELEGLDHHPIQFNSSHWMIEEASDDEQLRFLESKIMAVQMVLAYIAGLAGVEEKDKGVAEFVWNKSLWGELIKTETNSHFDNKIIGNLFAPIQALKDKDKLEQEISDAKKLYLNPKLFDFNLNDIRIEKFTELTLEPFDFNFKLVKLGWKFKFLLWKMKIKNQILSAINRYRNIGVLFFLFLTSSTAATASNLPRAFLSGINSLIVFLLTFLGSIFMIFKRGNTQAEGKINLTRMPDSLLRKLLITSPKGSFKNAVRKEIEKRIDDKKKARKTNSPTNPASIFYRHYLAKQEGRNYNPILAWMGNPITGSPVWEVIFNLSIPLTLHFLPGMTLIAGIAWLISNFIFAKAHADRSPPEQNVLFVVGLAFGLPFFIPGLDVLSQSLISIFIHSLYNFAKLRGWLPKWIPLASIQNQFKDLLNQPPSNALIELAREQLLSAKELGPIRSSVDILMEANAVPQLTADFRQTNNFSAKVSILTALGYLGATANLDEIERDSSFIADLGTQLAGRREEGGEIFKILSLQISSADAQKFIKNKISQGTLQNPTEEIGTLFFLAALKAMSDIPELKIDLQADKTILRDIITAREVFDVHDDEANATLTIGRSFFMTSLLQTFCFIAHELGHNLSPSQDGGTSEFIAELAALAFHQHLQLDEKAWWNFLGERNPSPAWLTLAVDQGKANKRHEAARTQLIVLKRWLNTHGQKWNWAMAFEHAVGINQRSGVKLDQMAKAVAALQLKPNSNPLIIGTAESRIPDGLQREWNLFIPNKNLKSDHRLVSNDSSRKARQDKAQRELEQKPKLNMQRGADALARILVSLSQNNREGTADAILIAQGLVDLGIADLFSKDRASFIYDWEKWSADSDFIALVRKIYKSKKGSELTRADIEENDFLATVFYSLGFSRDDFNKLTDGQKTEQPRVYIMKDRVEPALLMAAILKSGINKSTTIMVKSADADYYFKIIQTLNRLKEDIPITIQPYGDEKEVGLTGLKFDPNSVTAPLPQKKVLFILSAGLKFDGDAIKAGVVLWDNLLPTIERQNLMNIDKILRLVLSAA